MSNKSRIISDFSKLQQTPKFTDNQRITDIYIYILVHSFRKFYTWFCAHPNHTHIKTFVKKKATWGKTRKRKKKKATAQIGSNVRVRIFNAGLLARSQFASGRSCDRPTRPRFSVVPEQTNAELVPKFHAALLSCSLPNGNFTNLALH
jgi:hypothetical protein